VLTSVFNLLLYGIPERSCTSEHQLERAEYHSLVQRGSVREKVQWQMIPLLVVFLHARRSEHAFNGAINMLYHPIVIRMTRRSSRLFHNAWHSLLTTTLLKLLPWSECKIRGIPKPPIVIVDVSRKGIASTHLVKHPARQGHNGDRVWAQTLVPCP